MSRTGSNEYNGEGILRSGYDYELQCWVKDYIVQDCGHSLNNRELCGCYGRAHHGQPIENCRTAAGLPLRDAIQLQEYTDRGRPQQVTVTSDDGSRPGVTPGAMVTSNGTDSRPALPLPGAKQRSKRKTTCPDCGAQVRKIETVTDDDCETKTAYNCDRCDVLIYTVRFKYISK
jgi:hypothetical protein